MWILPPGGNVVIDPSILVIQDEIWKIKKKKTFCTEYLFTLYDDDICEIWFKNLEMTNIITLLS